MVSTNIYLFYGTENYLIEEATNKIINKIIPKDEIDLSVITYDLTNTTIEMVIEEAETLPFFSNHKLIIVKNALFFTGQKIKGVEFNLDVLEKFLDNPIDFSTIIFTVNTPKLDERKRIVKKIKKVGRVKSFTILEGNSLEEWVINFAKSNDIKITDNAIKILTLTHGNNLQILIQELSKMATYVGHGNIIDEDVVNELSSKILEQNIFTLIENIANLDIELAFIALYDLLKNKEEPIKIIALLVKQFRLMLLSKELARIGYSNKQIATQLGAHPYSIQIAIKQAAKFTETQLKDIMLKLSETDYNIKVGKIDKVLALEMFIFYLDKTRHNV